jgi:hypothetical protein
MENQPTCGNGLAERSVLPAKLGELTGAAAENLEVHMRALDLNDERSRQEHDVYSALAKAHRRIAAELGETARQMAGYRDLPMGKHDPKAMSSPRVLESFERFVQLEQEFLTLLQMKLEQDRGMLHAMRRAGAAAS